MSTEEKINDVSTEEQERTENEPYVPSFMCGLRHVEGYICTQRKDHTGVHVATGGDDFEPIIWPSVRTWSLPAEPGPEVTRLSSRSGDVILERHVDDPQYWVPRSTATGTQWDVLRWPDAFHQWQPLSDATPTGKDEQG